MSDSFMIDKNKIYRDSKTWYSEIQGGLRMVSVTHIDLCKKHAGKKILDLGCATGEYCLELNRLGFECVGADVNNSYIELAQKKGVLAYCVGDRLPFDDKAFDTVIMFEVLEHVQDPGKFLAEAARVAKKNVLISMPNCMGFEALKKERLVFEHFLELDHTNFFTRQSLSALLADHFDRFQVTEILPICAWLYDTTVFPKSILSILMRKTISLLRRLHLLTPKYCASLFAVAEIRG